MKIAPMNDHVSDLLACFARDRLPKTTNIVEGCHNSEAATSSKATSETTSEAANKREIKDQGKTNLKKAKIAEAPADNDSIIEGLQEVKDTLEEVTSKIADLMMRVHDQ